MIKLSENRVNEFKQLLESEAKKGRQKEQMIQDFLEENSEFIPVPYSDNHFLHFSLVLSKFPVGNDKTDFVYLTKSSKKWHVVLVELEDSKKKYFLDDQKDAKFTQDFNHAVQQVRNWRSYLQKNKTSFLNTLTQIRKPLSENPVDFKYVLIYGRSDEYRAYQQRKDALADLSTNDEIIIWSYDTLIDSLYYPNTIKKDILKYTKNKYEMKRMNRETTRLFAYLQPGDLIISDNILDEYRKLDYDIDQWQKGKALVVDCKYISEDFSKAVNSALESKKNA